LLLVVGIFLVSIVIVVAIGGDYTVHGHELNEIGSLQVINELECVSGRYNKDAGSYIYASTKGNAYNFDDVFIGHVYTSPSNYPGIECNLNNGWKMVGCSATTSMLSKGNDEYLVNENECRGKAGGTDVIYGRCCKVLFSDSSGNPDIHGHNPDEIGLLQKEIECVSGSYDENGAESIETSTGGETHDFNDVFTGTAQSGAAEIESKNGWIMTGCSSVTTGTDSDDDNDEYMTGINKCRSDSQGSEDVIYGRACRIYRDPGDGSWQIHGHDSGEINEDTRYLECISGSYYENGAKSIEASTQGNTYNFDDVFNTYITSFSVDGDEPVIECKNGWVVTGCSSSTEGTDAYDNDEYIIEENKCRGDQRGSNNAIHARCCRVV